MIGLLIVYFILGYAVGRAVGAKHRKFVNNKVR